jgi:ubiquinone/menaquinone biosynthesis C-methylase UbiE
MTETGPASAEALTVLKARMKATWMAGDFGRIATFSQAAADEFMRRRGDIAGASVLDVACGSGNLAIPAARMGATVTGVDIAANLLDEGRARAACDGLTIAFDEGDAEQLPYADGSFDLVVSMFGAMFAPRPERVVRELARVCRAGGHIAMANWTPDGFVGQMFRVTSLHVPPPPGIAPPVLWGDAVTVRARFQAAGLPGLAMTPVVADLAYPFSVPEVVEFFRTFFGPTKQAFAGLPPDKQDLLREDTERLWVAHNLATDGTTRVGAEYLEVVVSRGG